MYRSPNPRWTVEVFRVSSHERQQCILTSLSVVDRPGVVALGMDRGSDSFVVVESSSPHGLFDTHSIILALDPAAEQTFTSGRSRLAGPVPS